MNVKSSRKTTTEKKIKLNKMDSESEAQEMTNNGKQKKLNRPKFLTISYASNS